MRRSISTAVCFGGCMAMCVLANGELAKDYPIQPVPFTQVHAEGGFWAPRFETNRTVTVPYDFKKCEETGRIDNFAKAGGLMEGPFKGIFFDDSDVYKIIEGASYTLALQPDPALDVYLDDLIAKIAAAQEDDGYLYTARTIDPEHPAQGVAKERWGDTKNGHEMYNVGHLYEAAVAHWQATGKRALLDVAVKSANLICDTFGPGKLGFPPGHEEIEIGLVKLYRATGDRRYLDQAKFYVDTRGRADSHPLYGLYYQDHKTVLEQEEAVGHAVRAGYFYSGVADVAALTGEPAYIAAIDRLWDDVAARKLYLTGAIGARREGEAFGDAYELPNKTAYNETCAAIANALWNHRLFLLHGDAKYLDILERILYNGFLAGVSLGGDAFFYPNPLEADGAYPFNHGSCERQPWFGCSCCPSNVVRFMPSIPGYAYALRNGEVYVNLFLQGGAKMTLGGAALELKQTTAYPWDGAIAIAVEPAQPATFTLCVRIPGWAQGRPVPSDLYTCLDDAPGDVKLSLNGAQVPLELQNGFARIAREWKSGDTVTLELPMPIRRVIAHEAVEANRGRVALERGPIVYCAEALDNCGRVLNIALPGDAPLEPAREEDLLGGVTVISGKAKAAYRDPSGQVEIRDQIFKAIPYYAWCHRGIGEMQVWFPRDPANASPGPIPTIASRSKVSASHTWTTDTLHALNDQIEPKRSSDQEIPRHTWWDHRGGMEWVQYDFDKPYTIRAVEVYWFDDTGRGQCRLPASWRLLYLDGQTWNPIPNSTAFRVEKNTFNAVTFDPVQTTAVRIEANLRDGYSGGILEWRVNE